MLVLFDHGTPKGLAQSSSGHTVHTARSRGWNTRIRYQHSLRARQIALAVLTGSTKWSLQRQHADRVATAVASATPGSYAEVDVPLPSRPRRS